MSTNDVPQGIYRGRAVSAREMLSGKKETDFYEILCEITEEGEYKGRRLACQVWFTTEENATRALRTLQTCGWDGGDISKLEGFGSVDVDLDIQLDPVRENPDKPGEFYPQKTRVAFINECGSTAIGREMNAVEKDKFHLRLEALKVKLGIQKKTRTNGAAPTPPAATAPASTAPVAEPKF